MHIHSRLAAVLGCAATLALVGCATNGGLAPLTNSQQQSPASVGFNTGGWIQKDGVLYHTPHYMATRHEAALHKISPLNLNYGGGPVLVSPHVYLILWGYKTYGDSDGLASLLKNYMKYEGASSHDNIYKQYYEVSNGNDVYITNPRLQRDGVWDDETDAVPNNPTDAQVAAEALVGVAHFGYDANGSYVVATPHGHSSSGFGSVWCAYHSNTSYNGQYVSYTNLPYMPDAGPNCGANFISPPSDESGTDEGVTIVEGHEYGESITDPVPFSGWNSPQGEIGDLCAWQNIQNDPFRKGHSYTMQPMWSNASSSCVQGM
jgi:hypothetical protein